MEQSLQSGLAARKRHLNLVFEDLIRVSVGIEDIDDLKDDFAQAFANIAD